MGLTPAAAAGPSGHMCALNGGSDGQTWLSKYNPCAFEGCVCVCVGVCVCVYEREIEEEMSAYVTQLNT
jgi:hypothetical protein